MNKFNEKVNSYEKGAIPHFQSAIHNHEVHRRNMSIKNQYTRSPTSQAIILIMHFLPLQFARLKNRDKSCMRTENILHKNTKSLLQIGKVKIPSFDYST